MSDLHYNTLHKIVTEYEIMVNQDGYHAGLSKDKQRIHINPIIMEKDTSDGWKFHLSIKPEDLPKAWDAILEDIVKSGASAQVATPDHSELLNMEAPINSPDQGRMITLQGNNPQKMMDLAQTIEEKLIEEGIQPSQPALKAKAVEGSKFMSYSNEGPTKSFWESAPKDPFKDLAIDGDQSLAEDTAYKEKHHAATRLFNLVQHNYEGNIPPNSCMIDDGDNKKSSPSLCISASTEEQARNIAEELRENTGLNFQCISRTQDGDTKYIAIMSVYDPKGVGRNIDSYYEKNPPTGKSCNSHEIEKEGKA